MQNLVDRVIGVVAQLRQLHRRVEFDSARVFHFEIDPRRLFVQAKAHRLQLALQNLAVVLLFFLAGVQNHQNQIRRLSDRDYLPTSTPSIGSALDDTGKIQKLNAASLVVHVSWNARQRCKLVGGLLRLRICKVAIIDAKKRTLLQQRRLSHRWKADQGYASISNTGHFKAVSLGTRAAPRGGIEKLR